MGAMQVFVIDVDGVLIGSTRGLNYPDPHPAVVEALRAVEERGDKIVLCTGRPWFAAESLMRAANLCGFHISDSGALVKNPASGEKLVESILEPQVLRDLMDLFQPHSICFELHTEREYIIRTEDVGPLTKKHEEIVSIPHRVERSLKALIGRERVLRVFLIAKDPEERAGVEDLFQSAPRGLSLTWGPNPNALPAQFGWIMNDTVSKRGGVVAVSKRLEIGLEHFIGVGDNISDWEFMEICAQSAVVANGSEELKRLVAARGPNGHLLPSADENGIIKILDRAD